MDDLISRQAVIDIAKDLIITINGYEQYNQAVNNYSVKIMQLPSAQLKIIRCKDCNHFYKDNLNQWCFLGKYGVKEDDFCSRAERKTNE